MTHDRVRGVPAAVPRQPRAIRQVHVLVDHEKPLVESAERSEEAAPDQECRAARAEHFRGRRELAGAPAVSRLERAPGAKIAVTGAVDSIRIVQEDDPRGDEGVRRASGCGRVQTRQPRGIRDRVVVQEREPLAARRARARVVAACEAGVRVQRDDAHVRIRGRDERGGSVRRSVVDDDDFEGRRSGLRCQRMETARQPRPSVAVQDDDADPRRGRRGHVTR